MYFRVTLETTKRVLLLRHLFMIQNSTFLRVHTRKRHLDRITHDEPQGAGGFSSSLGSLQTVLQVPASSWRPTAQASQHRHPLQQRGPLTPTQREARFFMSNLVKTTKEDYKEPWQAAQWVRASSHYIKIADSIPGQGKYKNQPMSASISWIINQCFSLSHSLSNQSIRS